MSPWWQHLYDDNLAELLLEPDDNKEAEATLRFLQGHVGLQPGATIFDQCCGTGRLALVLARNHRVIGVDLIPTYIARAQAKLQQAQLCAEFICHDALCFQTAEPVDTALNWWTSFGYSGDEAVNRKMIQCAYQSLRRGGRYALDFMNVPGLYRHFQRDVMTQKNTAQGKLTLLRRSDIEFATDTLKKSWHYFRDGAAELSHSSRVKLYSPGQLATFFRLEGFADVRIYGGLDGQALDLSSPRCIVVGSKP